MVFRKGDYVIHARLAGGVIEVPSLGSSAVNAGAEVKSNTAKTFLNAYFIYASVADERAKTPMRQGPRRPRMAQSCSEQHAAKSQPKARPSGQWQRACSEVRFGSMKRHPCGRSKQIPSIGHARQSGPIDFNRRRFPCNQSERGSDWRTQCPPARNR